MYVCVCHAVSDRQIRECVDQGARSFLKCNAGFRSVAAVAGARTPQAKSSRSSSAHVRSATQPKGQA